tara:strand:+ start:671 stop:1162 length:492 start_codon:yes stop_codon:yes gene_type:complete
MENDKINCGVCYEDLKSEQFEILKCSHKICKKCHPKLVKLECPFCRTPFDKVEQVFHVNTIQNSTNLQDQLSALENQYDERLERRRERRQNRRQNRNSRPRSSNHELIGVFYMDEDIESDDEILIRQRSDSIPIQQNRNITNRYRKSNRWNDLNRQRQISGSF